MQTADRVQGIVGDNVAERFSPRVRAECNLCAAGGATLDLSARVAPEETQHVYSLPYEYSKSQ